MIKITFAQSFRVDHRCKVVDAGGVPVGNMMNMYSETAKTGAISQNPFPDELKVFKKPHEDAQDFDKAEDIRGRLQAHIEAVVSSVKKGKRIGSSEYWDRMVTIYSPWLYSHIDP